MQVQWRDSTVEVALSERPALAWTGLEERGGQAGLHGAGGAVLFDEVILSAMRR